MIDIIEFSHLGVRFVINAVDRELVDFFRHGFLDAYDSMTSSPADVTVKVTVDTGCLSPQTYTKSSPFHRATSFAHWNLFADVFTQGESACFDIRGRGLRICATSQFEYRMTLHDGVRGIDRTLGVEQIYTACRNLSLYLRAAERGNLIHASAVEFDGQSLIFVGGSMSGKTTMMIEAILAGGAPVANDRILIESSDDLTIESWPSYITFCEGTLLHYGALDKAAIDYDAGRYPLTTSTWDRPPEAVFSKMQKRLYPMDWLVKAFKKKYRQTSALGAIIFPVILPEGGDIVCERLDPARVADRNYLVETLSAQCFDEREDGFCGWHGMTLPSGSPSISNLVERLERADIRIMKLTVGADRLPVAFETLKSALLLI